MDEQRTNRYVTAMAIYVISLQRTMSTPVDLDLYTPPAGTMEDRLRLLDDICHRDYYDTDTDTDTVVGVWEDTDSD
jgi:hypothetical protein